jgi:glutaredoxin
LSAKGTVLFVDFVKLAQSGQLNDANEGKAKLAPLTNNWNTVPIVFHNKNFIGGCTDLESYLSKSEL